MGNKYNYENVLGEIACYIAKECNLTPSEAIGVVMNDDCTDAVIEEIQKSDKIDIEALASRYLTEELCAVDFKTDGYEVLRSYGRPHVQEDIRQSSKSNEKPSERPSVTQRR